MGHGSYSTDDWTKYSSSRKFDDHRTTTRDIYKSHSLDESLDPKKFSFRESVDGPDNPESTPIIIGLDVTGSMSPVLDSMARKGLKVVCEGIYNRKPIVDPHICVLGIGDVLCDRHPFQATQFEADIKIFEQLEKIYLEGGGGGNCFESYILAWYFAKYRTKTDSFEKRGRKGFIFTLGDEEITPAISAESLEMHLGEKQARSYTAKELFEIASKEWDIFHIVIKEGTHARYDMNGVLSSWRSVLSPQRVIPLDDHTKAGETIVSTLEMMGGKSLEETSSSWDGSTSVVVKKALEKFGGDGAIYVPRESNIDRYL
jgi:hypothetical protein